MGDPVIEKTLALVLPCRPPLAPGSFAVATNKTNPTIYLITATTTRHAQERRARCDGHHPALRLSPPPVVRHPRGRVRRDAPEAYLLSASRHFRHQRPRQPGLRQCSPSAGLWQGLGSRR